MGTMFDCWGQTKGVQSFRKQSENLREIKKGEGDRRSLTREDKGNLRCWQNY